MRTEQNVSGVTRVYYNESIDYECSSCGYDGKGFECYDEKMTDKNPDPSIDFCECPKCKHGNMTL